MQPGRLVWNGLSNAFWGTKVRRAQEMHLSQAALFRHRRRQTKGSIRTMESRVTRVSERREDT